MGAFVEFENVSKIYKTGDVEVHALTDASFEIQKGEFCVIVGESGAGKTTLLNILGGMDTLSKGTVRMDGRDISHFNRTQLENYRRYDIGFVFQFYNLIPNLTALENVEIAAQLCTDAIPAEDVLRAVGLHDRMQNFPAQLSGGEQQRVSIARALVTDLRTGSFAEGGSTITQQLAKNTLFTQEKHLARKAAEMFAALAIEKQYNKEQIFEMYVNTIYFGSGHYGIGEAAQGYFGKTPLQLTDAEAVMLAGLPNAPSAYSPNSSPDLAVKRMQVVLNRMVGCKKLTREQADALAAEAVTLQFLPAS